MNSKATVVLIIAVLTTIPRIVFADSGSAHAFAKLAITLKLAKVIRYTSVVKILTEPDENGPAKIVQFGVNAAIEQPEHYKMVIRQAGMDSYIFATAPDTGYVVDLAHQRYIKFESPDSPMGFLAGLSMSSGDLLPKDINAVFQTYQSVLDDHPFDLTSGQQSDVLTTSSGDTSFNGKYVKKIVQSGSRNGVTFSYRLLLDPNTFLPVHIEQSFTQNDRTIVPYQEDFYSWRLSSDEAPDNVFSYQPSPQEKLYVPVVDPSAPVPLAKGAIAPDFNAVDTSGKPVDLASFAGKPIVLDFWAPWCKPCQMSLPVTNHLATELSPRGVVFLGICSWDTKVNFDEWIKAHPDWAMIFAFDPAADDQSKSIAYTQYGLIGIPTQYVIGKDGKIVGGTSYYDPSDRHLRKLINRALAEPDPQPSPPTPAVATPSTPSATQMPPVKVP